MLTLFAILALAALVFALLALAGKVPVTAPVLILAIIEVLRVLPLGK